MILQNGLYGTIAYYKVRKRCESEILGDLKELLAERMKIADVTQMSPINDLDYMKGKQ